VDFGDYYNYLNEFPHLVLIFAIGFLTLFSFLPLYLFFIYPLDYSISFFMIFPYYWKNILLTWLFINPVFFFLLLFTFSYITGFIFIGFYDFIGNFYLRFFIRIGNYICVQLDKNGYSRIIKDAKQTMKEKKFQIGTSNYSKFQFELYKKENKNIQSYLNWEFLKCVSCGYLSFFLLLIIICYVIFTSFFNNISGDFSISIYNFNMWLLILLIIGFFSLVKGYLFYGSARYKGEVEAYNRLML
jgi:hypothetical protein